MTARPRRALARKARAVDETTPADRDRVADLVRVVSIVLVVLGHWLVAVILVEDGRLVVHRLLELEPGTRWLTWVFQVMPVFFLVGGFVNLGSWTQARDGGSTWSAWLHHRLVPLLVPLVPLFAFWILVVPLLLAARVPDDWVQTATQTAFAPLWFLATYVFLVALVPFTASMHRSWGAWSIAAFLGPAVLVDLLDRAGLPWVAYANLAFVWGGIHQCGYLWNDARDWNRPLAGSALVALGLAGMFGLVFGANYPLSMVTVGGDTPNNAGPPTIALFALMAAQAGVILVAWRALERALQRPRVWLVVTWMGGRTLAVFLWHVTALVLAAGLVHATGLWRPASIDATWWLTRPAWFVACAAILAALVRTARHVHSEARKGFDPGPLRVAFAVSAFLASIAWINRRGYEPANPYPSVAALLLLITALWSAGILRRVRWGRRAPPA